MAYIGKKPEDSFRGLAYYNTFTGATLKVTLLKFPEPSFPKV